jgi:hypothetical protein
LPAPFEHRRLLPFFEYLLSSLGVQIHAPELAPTAGVPTLPLLNSQPPRRLFKSINDQDATATESKISVSTTAVLRFITQQLDRVGAKAIGRKSHAVIEGTRSRYCWSGD